MVPYFKLGGDAPLANAFTERGLNFVSVLISVGAVCGLTTTVLVGLYVQVDTFLPSNFSFWCILSWCVMFGSSSMYRAYDFYYVQSRLYLGLGRDGLLPAFFAKIHDKYRTPVAAQIWVGTVAATLAGLFNVSHLSHILSVGCIVSILGRIRPLCTFCCFSKMLLILHISCYAWSLLQILCFFRSWSLVVVS